MGWVVPPTMSRPREKKNMQKKRKDLRSQIMTTQLRRCYILCPEVIYIVTIRGREGCPLTRIRVRELRNESISYMDEKGVHFHQFYNAITLTHTVPLPESCAELDTKPSVAFCALTSTHNTGRVIQCGVHCIVQQIVQQSSLHSTFISLLRFGPKTFLRQYRMAHKFVRKTANII